MNQDVYHVIGVMSGTSLDGVDLAYCRFDSGKGWQFEIIEAETIPYPLYWKEQLRNSVALSQEKLQILDKTYTHYLSKIIADFIQRKNIVVLDAVCSHGHTVLHQPENGITYQIGNLPELSSLLMQTVVCDFRKQDVKLCGQGAPLVPIGDRMLFGTYEYCLNLGGFANISSEIECRRIAFDICPVNIVMNMFAEKLGQPFDKDGAWAASGALHVKLLSSLNELSYYSKLPPKSLGLEWVQEKVLPLISKYKLSEIDVLRTFVGHIVTQVSNVVKPGTSILVTGGGAHNTFLMHEFRSEVKACFIRPERLIVDYKEALVFGLLGVLKMRQETNCLQSVTGAKMDHSSGEIYPFKID